MTERSIQDRIIFHDALQVLEVDFSGYSFSTREQVDAFYDHVDGQLGNLQGRWYFLVNYVDCTIAPEVWNRFAERGKHTNDWHVAHFIQPKNLIPNSVMPSYAYYFEEDGTPLKDGFALVAYVQWLGTTRVEDLP